MVYAGGEMHRLCRAKLQTGEKGNNTEIFQGFNDKILLEMASFLAGLDLVFILAAGDIFICYRRKIEYKKQI